MKHLLSAKDLTHDEAVMVLDTAEAMAATQRHAVKKLPTLRGKTVVNLFFEDSTRTRLSFEAAAKRLSADVINFSAKGSSVSKGESLKDTAQTIMAMGADAVVVRHSACGAAHLLAHAGWINVPVLNAGDGTHQHPTQALLDAMTLRRWYVPGAPATADGSPCPQGRDLEGARGHLPPIGRWLRGAQDMALLHRRSPGAVDLAAELAADLAFDLSLIAPELPDADVPEGHTPASWLRAEARAGSISTTRSGVMISRTTPISCMIRAGSSASSKSFWLV